MKRKVLAYPYIVWMVLFIVIPMFFILYYAVNVNGQFTVTKFWQTLKDASKWGILWRSVVISLKTTAICLLLGYPIAYILSNMKRSVAGFISVLFFVPMWMNFVLRTYAWHAILEYALPQLSDFLGLEGSVLMVLVYDFLPFMILPLYNTLSKLDRSLLEASRDLGANSVTTFFRVVLPLSVPGIVSGVTMVFIPAITAFTVPVLIGHGKYHLYGMEIEQAFKLLSGQGDYAVGSTLSIILLISVLVSTVIMNHFDKDQQTGGQMW
ncbi:MAG: ABC transporter permease [Clostridia bacterium]|nr:ABC transporter permease [Clostridia bacterium]